MIPASSNWILSGMGGAPRATKMPSQLSGFVRQKKLRGQPACHIQLTASQRRFWIGTSGSGQIDMVATGAKQGW